MFSTSADMLSCLLVGETSQERGSLWVERGSDPPNSLSVKYT